MLCRSTSSSISACSRSFSRMALAMRSTMRVWAGSADARALDLGGIRGGDELASESTDPCRACFRGTWNDMVEWLRSPASVELLLASHRELLAV
jgi:hypothetical protein